MIPCRLQFSGIRDFEPTELDLGTSGHIMITGPNGSGKSTITFCMGAVLYSSKVDVEGLRSRNLPPDRTWKATIGLLFKNDGQTKIDEPAWIEFSLHIIQYPGQPMIKEFLVMKGDQPDQWSETVKYISGDNSFNFSAYKSALKYHYKIDPDQFYLIWYQQEINQFAVMDPEERFRIFSEMYQIDKIQKQWEESVERLKDTKDLLQSAETNRKRHKLNLNLLKTSRDRLIDQQRRLRKGAGQSLSALKNLEIVYQHRIEADQQSIADLHKAIHADQERLSGLQSRKEEQQKKEQALQMQLKQTEDATEETARQHAQAEHERTQIQTETVKLKNELKGLLDRQKQIEHTEAGARALRSDLQQTHQATLTKLAENDSERESLTGRQTDLLRTIASLQQEIKEQEKQKQFFQALLSKFQSSYQVQAAIDQLGKSSNRHKEALMQTIRQLDALQKEKAALAKGRTLSERQQQSLDYFKARGVEAWPLRELVELDDTARLSDESLFDTIKYTIFFNDETAEPPNDLYHVPLKGMVPEKLIDRIPKIHLRIRENLDDRNYPYAAKALYWVQQFFQKTGIYIEHNTLHDPRGLRGRQEKQGYILSEKAIRLRRAEVARLLDKVSGQVDELKGQYDQETKQYQFLNGRIQQVKEAELFMTRRQERIKCREDLDDAEEALTGIISQLRDVGTAFQQLSQDRIEQEHRIGLVEKELDFYRALGESKLKYEALHQLQEKEAEKSREIESLKSEINRLERMTDECERSLSNLNRRQSVTQRTWERLSQEMETREAHRKQAQEHLENAKSDRVKVIQALQDFQKTVPDLYKELTAAFEPDTNSSEIQLKKSLEDGEITFNTAKNETGIDPAAQENYQKALEEFDRLEKEYQQTMVLLEGNKATVEKVRENLETTVNMRILEIKNRFTVYMGVFQFQGEISWESLTDKRDRTHFKLYVKARKEGHRGSMEDVSVKARGGRVGRGVSGGEESLSSLLFALALLRNLETAPSFIVLDEFDSALDEQRKNKVFDLYVDQLQRRLIVLTPKTHEKDYVDRFNKAFVVQHDPRIPRSRVIGIYMK